jgi:ABC-type antimicrobial peptide transport system permease subunit
LEENMGNFLPYVRIGAFNAALAVGLSMALAVAAAALPALRAARLDVTDALKRVV